MHIEFLLIHVLKTCKRSRQLNQHAQQSNSKQTDASFSKFYYKNINFYDRVDRHNIQIITMYRMTEIYWKKHPYGLPHMKIHATTNIKDCDFKHNHLSLTNTAIHKQMYRSQSLTNKFKENGIHSFFLKRFAQEAIFFIDIYTKCSWLKKLTIRTMLKNMESGLKTAHIHSVSVRITGSTPQSNLWYKANMHIYGFICLEEPLHIFLKVIFTEMFHSTMTLLQRHKYHLPNIESPTPMLQTHETHFPPLTGLCRQILLKVDNTHHLY